MKPMGISSADGQQSKGRGTGLYTHQETFEVFPAVNANKVGLRISREIVSGISSELLLFQRPDYERTHT